MSDTNQNTTSENRFPCPCGFHLSDLISDDGYFNEMNGRAAALDQIMQCCTLCGEEFIASDDEDMIWLVETCRECLSTDDQDRAMFDSWCETCVFDLADYLIHEGRTTPPGPDELAEENSEDEALPLPHLTLDENIQHLRDKVERLLTMERCRRAFNALLEAMEENGDVDENNDETKDN